jgi:Mn-dependent DtxR family transcriptional regulator
MQSTEKTRAFLMLEDNGQLAVREIARSLGVSPAIVMQWAEDFQRLGIAKLTDGKTLVLSLKKPVKGEE